LRDREALNKVIWKVYYEKPCTDMIGRVLGAGVKTGIYKITCLDNERCYVGQAVDVANRWKQHIKRGLGAEAPTRNKLYPAMNAIGVENFTFELLEECPKEKLDAQEDYWQEFFHARDFGYSIK
jgi:group I intron endonuclease